LVPGEPSHLFFACAQRNSYCTGQNDSHQFNKYVSQSPAPNHAECGFVGQWFRQLQASHLLSRVLVPSPYHYLHLFPVNHQFMRDTDDSKQELCLKKMNPTASSLATANAPAYVVSLPSLRGPPSCNLTKPNPV
jgi:hypothetical protein